MQIAAFVRRIILSSVACLGLPYFSTLFHKRHDFRKELYLTLNVCFDFLYKSVWKIDVWEQFTAILSRMYLGLQVKCRLFLSYFKQTWIFSTDCRKVLKHQTSRKSVQWEPSCSMRTDGPDEANSQFSQFYESAWRWPHIGWSMRNSTWNSPYK